MNRQLPYLRELTPDRVQQIIEDVLLMKAGVEIYFAVDPHELFDFCFPIDPTASRTRSIDAIADDQAALYEIFFGRKNKVLLLQDYVSEIRGLINYFEHLGDQMYDAAEMVDALMSEGSVDELIDSAQTVSEEKQSRSLQKERLDEFNRERLVALLEDKFNIVLAVAMGIYSLGVVRFKKICADLLSGERIQSPRGIRALGEIKVSGDRTKRIFDEIIRNVARPTTAFEEERIRRSAYNDSRAIDWLLVANDALVRESIHRRTPNPEALILYVSDAKRTEKVFDMPAVRNRLPFINNKIFSFHRNRAQMFTYVVHKSDRDDFVETIERLYEVKRVLLELQKFDRSAEFCSQCILDNQQPSYCDFQMVCEGVKRLSDTIERKRAEIRNLGLLNTLDDYQRLLSATPKGQSQERFMSFFKDVYQTRLRDIAKTRMLEKQQLLFMQSVLTEMWTRARSLSMEDEFLRAGRDVVTGTIQYLPLNPIVYNETYSEVLKLILKYYRTPPKGGKDKLDTIDQAYKLYLNIDVNVSSLDAEHELVRCLLYLAFPSSEGDLRTYNHAQRMLQKKDVMNAAQYCEREYLYILAWAGRRLKKYHDAIDYATQAINRFKDDPRFYHARAITIYACLADPSARQDCNYTIQDAIGDARTAIALFRNTKQNPKAPVGATHEELIGGNLNNIAYLAAWEAELSLQNEIKRARQSIKEARQALNDLKKSIEPGHWLPMFPEYFHTEAFVEYSEFKVWSRAGTREKVLVKKLENALKAIDSALLGNPKRAYQGLKAEIENDLRHLTK